MDAQPPAHLLEDPPGFYAFPSRRSSVHGSTYRLDVAQKQAQLNVTEPASVERVCALANQALELMGVEPVANPVCAVDPATIQPDGMLALNYEAIAQENHLASVHDLVHIRFSADGCPVVVAVSNDVNFFPIPERDAWNQCDPAGRWRYKTAPIILSALGKVWDTSFYLLFPLKGLSQTGYSRHDIEKAVGNHLLANGVHLLDAYSHVY